jgi:O-methyltransferase involved in polyketide biosynthesis
MAFQTPVTSGNAPAGFTTAPSAASLSPVESTLLIPLIARAHGAQAFAHMAVQDACASAALAGLHLDEDDLEPYLQDRLSVYGVLARTRILRSLAQDFFVRHPRGWAVNLGCGLSSYFQWLDRGHNQWLDADLPAVMSLRESLLPSLGQRHHDAVVDLRQPHWWGSLGLPEGAQGPPVWVMLEGVLMYLQPEEVRQVLHEFAAHAPPGSELVFDSLSWMATGWAALHASVSHTQAQFLWGARQMSDFTRAHPRLRLLSEHSVLDGYDLASAWLCPTFRALWGVPMYGIIRLGLAH